MTEHETKLVAVVQECTRSSSKVNHFQKKLIQTYFAYTDVLLRPITLLSQNKLKMFA